MKKLQFGLILFVLLFLASCSNDVAGGGDDFPNSMVAGVVVDSEGSGVGNVEVELIPYNYNPMTDSENRIYKDTTDSNGNYLFEVDINSIYTIYAKDHSTGKRLLRFEQPVFLPNTDVGSDTLRPTGSIECLFPDSIEESGYVYISGTPFHTGLEEGIVRIDGKFSVMMDSLPETEVPAVLMRTSSKKVVGNFVNVKATDTIPIGDTATLPYWEFKVLVGISQETSQQYGSLDTVISLVQKQVRAAMNKFNYPGVFDGVLNFVIDSVYEFTQNDTLELQADWKSYSNADYRIIYDAYPINYGSTWSSAYKTARMVADDPDSLFTSNRKDALVWFFGLARGCFGLNWMQVKGENNPVNGQDYLGIKSIMNNPYGETLWDDYSVNVINYYADEVYEGSVMTTRLLPDSFVISVVSENGEPLEGAEVSVYQVESHSYAVEDYVQLSGITNSEGEALLSANPYDADGDGILAALNCLVTSVYNSDTSYYWMPITDAVNSWMEDNNKPYKVIITH